MAIVGIGLDVVQISRIEAVLERHGSRFLKRVFHPVEVEQAFRRVKSAEYLAGCFAVKESALKAFGDFPGRGIPWFDIYITHERTGKPLLHFAGRAKVLADEKQVTAAYVAITHDADMAIAQVILEK